MAWSITVKDADDYFKPNVHEHGLFWDKQKPNDKKWAFARAVVLLEASENRAMEDPDSDADSSSIHDDFAVFAQAVYMLQNVSRQQEPGRGGAVRKRKSKAEQEENPVIAPMATFFFRNSTAIMERG